MGALNVIAVCGHGLGSSLMLKITLEHVFGQLGVDALIETVNAGEAGGYFRHADLIITSPEISKMLDLPPSLPMVTIRNFLDKREITEKVTECIQGKGLK